MSTTAERIRKLRQENNLSLDDVARHLGVGRQAIHKYEQGTVTNIPLENIEKMANLFGTTPSYLACWEDEPKHAGVQELTEDFNPDLLPALDSKVDPKTDELRILVRGLNKLTPEQIEQVKDLVQTLFKKSDPNLFGEKGEE